jgi:uncharacterized protein (TIGR03435 family)
MKPNGTDELLRRFIGRYGNPSEAQVSSQIDRAWRELQSAPRDESKVGVDSSASRLRVGRTWRLALSGAAVLATVVIVWRLSPKQDVPPVFDNVNVAPVKQPTATLAGGPIDFGQVIRNSKEVATLFLQDGSRVEMNSQSELTLEKADDGVRIRLNAGNIIVTAAKQRSGHLYVQTKDVMVSVVGTVFTVNAEEEGSRVAVIDGEVQVRQGNDVKKLLPGQQVATGPSMLAVPVEANVAWSSSAPAHLALLQQSTTNTAPLTTTLKFAADSVKLFDPAKPLIGAGFGCRGIDGKRLAPFGEGGEPPFTIPLGRCVGNGVSIPALIAFAYNLPHRYAPGAPDWASTGTLTTFTDTDNPTGTPRTIQTRVRTRFQIDAVADNPSAVTTAELRQMMQNLLTERFQMKAHREVQSASGYALTVGASPRLKEASGDATPLLVDFTNPGRPVLRGKATIDQFLVFILGFTNPSGYADGELPAYIVNRTGLVGIYEWEFVMPIPGGDGRGNSTPPPPGQPAIAPPAANRFAWRAPATAAALESQLGLKLQPQQIPVEVLVVEHLENPSAN